MKCSRTFASQGSALALLFLAVAPAFGRAYVWRNVTIGGGEFVTGIITHPNAPGAGLGSNWFIVTGSALANQLTIPVAAVNGSVFFRLLHP